MTAGLLPAVIEHMSRSYPGVVFNISQALFASAHYRELRDRNIDVLLGRVFTPLDEDDLDVAPLFDDEMVVVAAKRSTLFTKRRLALADLAEHRGLVTAAGRYACGATFSRLRSSVRMVLNSREPR